MYRLLAFGDILHVHARRGRTCAYSSVAHLCETGLVHLHKTRLVHAHIPVLHICTVLDFRTFSEDWIYRCAHSGVAHMRRTRVAHLLRDCVYACAQSGAAHVRHTVLYTHINTVYEKVRTFQCGARAQNWTCAPSQRLC